MGDVPLNPCGSISLGSKQVLFPNPSKLCCMVLVERKFRALSRAFPLTLYNACEYGLLRQPISVLTTQELMCSQFNPLLQVERTVVPSISPLILRCYTSPHN